MQFSIPVDGLDHVQYPTLSDSRCRVEVAGGRLIGTVDLNACGTTITFTNDTVIFRNDIYTSPNATDVIALQCTYDRYVDLQMSYLPVVRHVLFTEAGIGQFSLYLQQFTDASFSSAVRDGQYPVQVSPGQDVYLQVSQDNPAPCSNASGCLGLKVVDCVASPHSSLLAARDDAVPLIHDGCPVSGSHARLLPTASRDAADSLRFAFRVVTHSRTPAVVYVHCRVALCDRKECGPPGGNCQAPSTLQRSRRAVMKGGTHGDSTRQVSTGPFLVQAEQSGGLASASASRLSSAVSLALAAMTTAVSVVAVVA